MTETIESPGVEQVFAESPAMRDLLRELRAVAASGADLLIVCEPGTGRSLMARLVHLHSADPAAQFIEVDCADHAQIDLRLFGHARAAGDRGHAPRLGPSAALLAAGSGTLLLRDLESLPARVQAALARLLRDRRALMCDMTEVPLTTRVIATVDGQLDLAVNEGRLRADLYRQLASARLEMPPLRHRREDIPLLARHVLSQQAQRAGTVPKTISKPALAVLAALPWRDNVPELHRLLERAVQSAPSRSIDVDDIVTLLPSPTSPAPLAARPLRDARAEFERGYITTVLEHCGWRIPHAARALGLARPNLYRKMRALGISRAK